MSTPTFRRVVDATRASAPGDLGCVIDTALTSEAVAIAFDARVGTTIVVITRAVVNCPALSKLDEDRYVATIGGGRLVTDRKASVLASPQWEWAREYLVTNPIAIAAELPAKRVLAVAQPNPLDGWVAIDALEPTAIDKQLGELGARWRTEGKTQLGTKLKTSRSGAQVVARLEKPEVDDLIALINDLARSSDAPRPQAAAFACPPVSDIVKSCSGTSLVVTSIKRALDTASLAEDSEPQIAGGEVIGLRLLHDGPVLRAGDIILGVGARRVGTAAQLGSLLDAEGPKVALAIRRNGADMTLIVSESP